MHQLAGFVPVKRWYADGGVSCEVASWGLMGGDAELTLLLAGGVVWLFGAGGWVVGGVAGFFDGVGDELFSAVAQGGLSP